MRKLAQRQQRDQQEEAEQAEEVVVEAAQPEAGAVHARAGAAERVARRRVRFKLPAGWEGMRREVYERARFDAATEGIFDEMDRLLEAIQAGDA